MKILALETSTSEGGIAIMEDQIVLAEHPFKTNENFGQNLFPLIDQIFKETKLTLKDLGLIAVNAGPGSYTGLRVGVTCANTLSWVNQIPSVGISNLYNMVYSSNLQGKIGALLYGNDKEAFFASYQKDKANLTQISPDEKVNWESAQVKSALCDHIIYFTTKKQELPPIKNLIEWHPEVNFIGKSGLKLFNTQSEKNFGKILPNYLRDFEVTPKQK
jgi:tRNA threonylcarbamoyl adenosine modification protein YeaZ